MNRKEKRRLKNEINMFSDVVNIIKQYFPELIDKLEKLTDTRHQSYVEYKMSVITVTRLLGFLCGIKSMRNTTEKFNTEETIKNIAELLNLELKEIPHYDTINNVFEKLEIEELRKIQKYMVNKLIRSKMFDKYRYKGKYFQVVVDGTGIMSFKERHCKHCLKRTYNKGEENEYSIYYHYVLEAKLVVGDIVISMDSEFVENEEENVEKEIKYWNNLKYQEVKRDKEANVIKYYEKEETETREFMRITSFKITDKNKEEIVYYGKQRWKIENEGFNMQKNGTFDIEHMYSRNYNAMKAHYFFIQFAHTIRQLLEKGLKYIKELKISIKEVSAAITQTLTQKLLNLTEHRKVQLRFSS